jgi:hypothetical protein
MQTAEREITELCEHCHYPTLHLMSPSSNKLSCMECRYSKYSLRRDL